MSQFPADVPFEAPGQYDDDDDLDPSSQEHPQPQHSQHISQEYFKVDKPSYVWSVIYKLKTPQLNKRQKMCFYVCMKCIEENVPWQDCLINLVKQNPSNGTLHIKNRHPVVWNDHVDAQAGIEKKEKAKLEVGATTNNVQATPPAVSRKRARPSPYQPSIESLELPRVNVASLLPPKQYDEDITNAERETLELRRLDIELRYDLESQRLAIERHREERSEREFELKQRLMLAQTKEAEFNLKANRMRVKLEMTKLGATAQQLSLVLGDEVAL
ncbi:hypothetical protein DYB30_001218 [Aphanomyces astaci]|uniref:No apical meristem-associated C-terminal domain-containing protein n=1 Tax=Aphanomyces astaci TaxID=112090 RepID=A0A397DZZ7_APHAT|nr:hypothetical protein DYB30_001218 [Aphanomyces astaci]